MIIIGTDSRRGLHVALMEDAVEREDAAGWQLAFLQDRERFGREEPPQTAVVVDWFCLLTMNG